MSIQTNACDTKTPNQPQGASRGGDRREGESTRPGGTAPRVDGGLLGTTAVSLNGPKVAVYVPVAFFGLSAVLATNTKIMVD